MTTVQDSQWVRLLRPATDELLAPACHASTIENAIRAVGHDPVHWAIQIGNAVALSNVDAAPEFGGSEAALRIKRLGPESVAIQALLSIDAGKVVDPGVTPEAEAQIREFVHRRIPIERVWASIRLGHSLLADHFMTACQQLVAPALQAEQLRLISRTLLEFIDSYAQGVTNAYHDEEQAWLSSAAAARDEMIRAILAGEDRMSETMHRALRYDVVGQEHVGVILHSVDHTATDGALLHRVAQSALHDAGATSTLLMPVGNAQLFAWGGASGARQVLYEFRNLIRLHRDELAGLITEQHGKTLDDARGEVARGLDSVELACGVPVLVKGETSEQSSTGIDTISMLHPLGVVLGITPFNFPVMLPLMMAAVAIACGNTFILKPSEQDPGPALRVAELAHQAGLPNGVLNVVQGRRDVAEALIDSPEIAAVSFVGSTAAAHDVYRRAAESGKRVQAFGGAKNHLVVMPDAPIEAAADAISSAGFGAAGQRCMAISVAVAVGGIGDELVAALAERANAVVVGTGKAHSTQMGPVVSAEAQQRIRRIVADAKADGADVVVDRTTETVPGGEQGYFVGPAVVDHVKKSDDIYRTEVFGPVVCVLRVDTLDEALDLIRNHEYGNGAAIFTRSGAVARTFQRQAAAGMVGVNVPIPVPVASYAVAGWKSSAFGDTGMNNAAWRFYTQPKYVTSRWDEAVVGADYGFRPN